MYKPIYTHKYMKTNLLAHTRPEYIYIYILLDLVFCIILDGKKNFIFY